MLQRPRRRGPDRVDKSIVRAAVITSVHRKNVRDGPARHEQVMPEAPEAALPAPTSVGRKGCNQKFGDTRLTASFRANRRRLSTAWSGRRSRTTSRRCSTSPGSRYLAHAIVGVADRAMVIPPQVSRALGARLSPELSQHRVCANTSFVTPRAWLDRFTLAPTPTTPSTRVLSRGASWRCPPTHPSGTSQGAFDMFTQYAYNGLYGGKATEGKGGAKRGRHSCSRDSGGKSGLDGGRQEG
jgi:hypothetical protein